MSWPVAISIACLIFLVTQIRRKDEENSDVKASFLILGSLVVLAHVPIDGVPTFHRLLYEVLGNSALISLAALLVFQRGLERCGFFTVVSDLMSTASRRGVFTFRFLFVLLVAASAALASAKRTVHVLLRDSMELSLRFSSQSFPLLLLFASRVGGMCTLVGFTSFLIIDATTTAGGSPPLGLFEIARIGLPVALAGMLYLALTPNLIPPQEEQVHSIPRQVTQPYLLKAEVELPKSGKPVSIADLGIESEEGIQLMELRRQGRNFRVLDSSLATLQEGDLLVLSVIPSGLSRLMSIPQLNVVVFASVDLRKYLEYYSPCLVEGFISPRSTLLGQSIEEIAFRQRFRVLLFGIARPSDPDLEPLPSTRIETGDLLLVSGSNMAVEGLRRSDDILLLDRPQFSTISFEKKLPIIGAIASLMFLATYLGFFPWVGAMVLLSIGTYVVVGMRAFEVADEWSKLVGLFGVFAVDSLLRSSGTYSLLLSIDNDIPIFDLLDRAQTFYFSLAVVYILTLAISELVSSPLSGILMASMSLELAPQLGVCPKPFIMAVMVASAATFLGSGDGMNKLIRDNCKYSPRVFFMAGAPLEIIYFLSCVVLIPEIWPFLPQP